MTGTVVAATTQVVQAIKQLDAEDAGGAQDAVRATMDGILTRLRTSQNHFRADDTQVDLNALVHPREPADVLRSHIRVARNLEEAVGALLPTAWVHFCAQGGYEGRQRIEATMAANAQLHRAITALETSLEGNAEHVDDLRDEVAAATRGLAASIQKLRAMVDTL